MCLCKIDWNLVIQASIAFGTLAVAALAIWGDWVRFKLASPNLRIVLHDANGELGIIGNEQIKALYYHLKVISNRSWSPATNCKVVLVGIEKKLPNGDFKLISQIIESAFRWSPAYLTPPTITIYEQQIFDFITLAEGAQRMEPRLTHTPSDFEGYVQSGGTIRFQLKIISDQFHQKKPQVFEVAWDGEWPEKSRDSVIIKEIV